MSTLVDHLRDVDSRFRDFITLGHLNEYWKIFESFRKGNPLLENIIKGETTTFNEVRAVLEKLEGSKSIIPIFYVPSVEEREHYLQLRQIVGYPSIINVINVLVEERLTGWAGLFAGIYYYYRKTKSQQQDINRRDFIRHSLTGGAIGALAGGGTSHIALRITNIVLIDANYVDVTLSNLRKHGFYPQIN